VRVHRAEERGPSERRWRCPTRGRPAANAVRCRSRERRGDACRARSLTSSPASRYPSSAPRSIGTRDYYSGDPRTRALGKKSSGTSTSTPGSSSSPTLAGRRPDHPRRRRSRRAPGALGRPRHRARTDRDLPEPCPPREGPGSGWERDRVRRATGVLDAFIAERTCGDPRDHAESEVAIRLMSRKTQRLRSSCPLARVLNPQARHSAQNGLTGLPGPRRSEVSIARHRARVFVLGDAMRTGESRLLGPIQLLPAG